MSKHTVDVVIRAGDGAMERSYGAGFDPESLLTEGEIRAGFDYTNSHRKWMGPVAKQTAYEGNLSTDRILALGPRVRNLEAGV